MDRAGIRNSRVQNIAHWATTPSPYQAGLRIHHFHIDHNAPSLNPWNSEYLYPFSKTNNTSTIKATLKVTMEPFPRDAFLTQTS